MVSKAQAAADIVAAIALLFFSALLATVVANALVPGRPHLALIVVLQAALVLIGLRALLEPRGERWRDIGLGRIRAQHVPQAFAALVLCLVAGSVVNLLVYIISPDELATHLQGLQGVASELTTGQPFSITVLMLLLVGFYEELLARGLLLARARTLLGGTWRPVLLASLLFGLGHWYQGWLGVVQTAAIGTVFAALTLRWGTLWPAILAHAGLNIISIAGIEKLDIALLSRGLNGSF